MLEVTHMLLSFPDCEYLLTAANDHLESTIGFSPAIGDDLLAPAQRVWADEDRWSRLCQHRARHSMALRALGAD